MCWLRCGPENLSSTTRTDQARQARSFSFIHASSSSPSDGIRPEPVRRSATHRCRRGESEAVSLGCPFVDDRVEGFGDEHVGAAVNFARECKADGVLLRSLHRIAPEY